MLTTFRAPLALGLLCLAAGSAAAQVVLGSYEGAVANTPGGLWQREDVRKQLKPTAGQLEKVNQALQPVRARYEEEVRRLKKPGVEYLAQQYEKLRQETAAAAAQAVNDGLEPEQRKRLRQIRLQAQGGDAFRDPEVQAELKLTDAQKKQIETLAQEHKKGLERLHREASGLTTKTPGGQPTPYFLEQEFRVRTRAVLNPEQGKLWREIIGEPFPPRPSPPAKKGS